MKKSIKKATYVPYSKKQTDIKKKKLGKKMKIAQDNGLGDNLTPYRFEFAGPVSYSTNQGLNNAFINQSYQNQESRQPRQKAKGWEKFLSGYLGFLSKLPGTSFLINMSKTFVPGMDDFMKHPRNEKAVAKGEIVGQGVTDLATQIASAVGGNPAGAMNSGSNVQDNSAKINDATGWDANNPSPYNPYNYNNTAYQSQEIPNFNTGNINAEPSYVKYGGKPINTINNMYYKNKIRKRKLYQMGGSITASSEHPIGAEQEVQGGTIKKVASDVISAHGQKHEGPNEGIDYENIKIEDNELILQLEDGEEVVFSDTIPVPRDVIDNMPKILLPEKKTNDLMIVNYNPSIYSFAAVCLVVAKKKGNAEKKLEKFIETRKNAAYDTIDLLEDEIDNYYDILESLYELQEDIATEYGLRDENGYPVQNKEIVTENMLKNKEDNDIYSYGDMLYERSGRAQKDDEEEMEREEQENKQIEDNVNSNENLTSEQKQNAIESQKSQKNMYQQGYQSAGPMQQPQQQTQGQGMDINQAQQILEQFMQAFQKSGQKDVVAFLQTLPPDVQEAVKMAIQIVKGAEGQQASMQQQAPMDQQAAMQQQGQMTAAYGGNSNRLYRGRRYQEGGQMASTDDMNARLQYYMQDAEQKGFDIQDQNQLREYVSTLSPEEQQEFIQIIQAMQQSQGQGMQEQEQMEAMYGGKKKLYRKKKC